MRPSIRRFVRTIRGLDVDQAANCARALSSMVGPLPTGDWLPGGAARVTRAQLTGRALGAWPAAPWPHALMRQQDPEDPAFLPPIGIHPVLAARDRTALGMPGPDENAWVDPDGWAAVGTGPAVTVWFGDDDGAFALGRSPGAFGRVAAHQHRSDSRVGVRTSRTVRDIECLVVHWPVILDGRVAWVVNCRVTLLGDQPRNVRMGIFVRPATLEGARPIFRLQRSADGMWNADGENVLCFGRPGDRMLAGTLADGADPWFRFAQGEMDALPRPGRADVRCSVGSCSAGEVWQATLTPHTSLSRFAVLGPPPGAPVALGRTTAQSLFTSANSDRRGLLASGCALSFDDPPDVAAGTVDALLDAVRVRLLIGCEQGGLAGSLAAVCLARLGFTRRAGDRLAAELERVTRTGAYLGEDAEEAGVLAWAAGQYVMWTGDNAWLGEQIRPWARLLDHLLQTEPVAGGRMLFGMGGSVRWTQIWRMAGLISSAWVLRSHSKHSEWTLAGGRLRETLRHELGAGPWSADVGRTPDGASVAPLAAVWLGLIPPTHPGVTPTLDLLRSRFWHGGGVLLQGGAHVAATCMVEATQALVNPQHNPLPAIVRLASPTGALPTARHPSRGALGEGDDPLSAALFGILALDRLRVEPRRLTLLPGLRSAADLPTPFGRVDIVPATNGERGRIVGRWRGSAPRLGTLDT